MSQTTETKKRTALSGWPMLLAWLAMFIFAFHASTHMVGTGDTWIAMACGRHFLNHGVDTIEPFSANSHKPGPTPQEIKTWPDWAQWLANKVGPKAVKYWHPTGWVNQNWLTHVIFYWLTHESPFADAENRSFNTLVYWKFAIYIITVICVYYTTRLLGVNPALSAVFACFAMFVGRSFLDIRPAGFSNLLVAAFLLILVLATYRNVLYIWLIVPVVTFWCNVHGGYIYAFIVLVPFLALNLLTSFSKKRFVSIGLKGTYHTTAAGFVAFLAMIIFNPFHLTNLTHTFVISVSEHAKMWRAVREWHPSFAWSNPVGTSFPFLVLFILCFGLPALWLYSRFLKPKLLKAPKNELDRQKKLFTTLAKIFGCAAAVFICWVTFISFSSLNLDPRDFFICAVFVIILLFSIYKNVHFIYLQIPLLLLALWLGAPENYYAGRYFYPFLLLPVYVTLHILVSLSSKTVKTKAANVIFPAATAVVILFLMVAIFNPFKFGLRSSIRSQFQSHLDNGIMSQKLRAEFAKNRLTLSESARISVQKPGSKWLITDNSKKYSVRREQGKLNIYKYGSPVRHMKQIFHLRRKWIPRYEGKRTLSYTHLFTTIYIVNIASVIVWLIVPHLRNLFRRRQDRTNEEAQAGPYQLPKIDLAMMAVAALTVYMAYRSRRFIPIAAFAACPILAMFIDQMTRTVSAAHNFHQKNHLAVPPMPYSLQAFFTIAGAVAVLGLGTWWGLKFKSVYLDPWPTDPKLSSVFMRMTASYTKPFYACEFIKDNKLKGKMFNYWTEGGFIAWGQQPDPNTGKTPLQLFMDGRAQAAYGPKAYRVWLDIMPGGPTVRSVKAKKRQFTSADYKKIGRWIDKQLKERDVWVVLMPAGQLSTPFVKGLEHHPDWRLILFNDKEKLFVDSRTPRAQELFEGIFDGKTRYPDDFSRNLIIAHHSLSPHKEKDVRKQGLDAAIKAFKLNPSQSPTLKIISAVRRFPELKPRVDEFWKNYFNDFAKNKNSWARQDGYHDKIVAALNAARYLRNIAKNQRDAVSVQLYDARIKEYNNERRRVVKTKAW